MTMKRCCALLALLVALTFSVRAADPELAGNWIGSISTNRGTMDIGLSLKTEKDKLVGVLKTGHGDWPVTGVSQKDDVWTVEFKGADNEGRLIGRIKGNAFTGDWKSAMADGTFEMTRAKK
jgi:hypothetical protein